MEVNERRVLQKAFAHIDCLRRKPLLRLQALSFAARSAAIMYDEAGLPVPALARILKSLALWPFPYTGSEDGLVWVRTWKLLVISLRLLRLRQSVRSSAAQA